MHIDRKWVGTWALVVALGAGCQHQDDRTADKGTANAATAPIEGAAPTPSPAPPAPAPPEPSPLERILAAPSLPEAIEQVKPLMTDTDDETSPGALALAVWSAKRLAWKDIAMTKNETSFALVHKDPDAARGKRMCVRGNIVQITKLDLADSVVFHGLMLSGYSNIVSFIAAGSTGELVEQSYARFCGVVIGTYDYSNSGGGKGHAISVVGMFDLPENRAK